MSFLFFDSPDRNESESVNFLKDSWVPKSIPNFWEPVWSDSTPEGFKNLFSPSMDSLMAETLPPEAEKTKNETTTEMERRAVFLAMLAILCHLAMTLPEFQQVIPAIKVKWSNFASKDITIQQDNATPHTTDNDPEFRHVSSSDGFNIHLEFQPPNSPDTNINDLGWFRALQSLQVKTSSYTIGALLRAVESNFEDLSHTTLNFVFLSLQGCMVEILKAKGHNNYKTPLMKKEAQLKTGTLSHVLVMDKYLVKECIDYLVELNKADGLEEWITEMNQLE